jgi:hypothetical protein
MPPAVQGTKLVVVSQGLAGDLDIPEMVAIFDLNNVIHILFISYMIYIIFESSSFAESVLLIKTLILLGLCVYAYHIFISDDSSGCCVRIAPSSEPSELEEEREILLSTPEEQKQEQEKTEEFAELLKDPAISPPKKSSSPKA